MTAADFSAKWDIRFADNTTFQIDEADFREFKDDLLLVFGLVGATTPVYVPGTTYTVGFLVRYTPAGGKEAFYYALNAGQLTAPGPGNVTDWKVVPGPVSATELWQPITWLAAQGIEGAGVQAGRLYQLDRGLNQAGKQQYVYLNGLDQYFDTTRGVLEVDGVRTAIEHIDLNAGTWQVAGTGAAIPLAGTAAGKSVAGPVVFEDNIGIRFTSAGGDFDLYGDGGQLSIVSVATGNLVAFITEKGLGLVNSSIKFNTTGLTPVSGELTIDANGDLLVNGKRPGAGSGRVYISMGAPGAGNLAREAFPIFPGEGGHFTLASYSNVSDVEIIDDNGGSVAFSGPISQLDVNGVILADGRRYQVTLTPVSVTTAVLVNLIK